MLKANKAETNRSRGGRLARRARSFKDDFIGRINQIRSPSGTRTGSPCKNVKNKVKAVSENQADATADSGQSKEVESIVHSVHLLSTDLRYFQDVVAKNILEMLPGSATVILETVLNIHSVLRESLVSEQSSLMLSASNQVYQALANLICWSDNVLLYGEKAVEKESVVEIVQAVHDAVKSLVHLSLDRLQHKDSKSVTDFSPSCEVHPSSKHESPHRNSLPEIPLTPREREILEETKFTDLLPSLPQLHHSASSDSILGKKSIHLSLDESQPPPKPPLPVFREGVISESFVENPDTAFNHDYRLDSAPPLPPKKKPGFIINLNFEDTSLPSITDSTTLFGSYGSINTELSSLQAQEWSSPHNHSPENLTSFSKSSASSLDSNLNSSIDDLLSLGQFRRVQCSHTHNETCIKHSVVSDLTSRTYNSELSSYSSTMATTKTSLSLHSGDFENTDLLSRTLKESDLIKCVATSKESQLEPPALPVKLRTLKNRTVSQYDNFPQFIVSDLEEDFGGHSIQCPRAHSPQSWLSGNHSLLCPHHQSGTESDENGKPPPLPPKKKTIMAYMQMFGSYSQPSESEFLRHSVHTYKVVQADWQQVELSFMQQHSFTSSFVSNSDDSVFLDGNSYNNAEKSNESIEANPPNTPPVLPPKKNQSNSNSKYSKSSKAPSILPLSMPFLDNSKCQNSPASHCFEKPHWHSIDNIGDNSVENEDHGALDELDASEHLICKKLGEEGPDIRGGSVDSLIVQATKATKNDFLYQEAFLTTYRTFISPFDLVAKLLYRYNKFSHMSDMRQRAARNSFSLLVRVVDDMCLTDVTEEILKILMDFICQLVSRGDLLLARALRKKVVEKCASKQRSVMNAPILLPSMAVTTHKASILDFKSESIAEQMTVLDADLFQKIEIPEVLLWAKEQKEELSPNLTTFTEHFNKMSYWARTRILEQEEAKDRERYVVKFIKVMKYLRKLNNFNSYLAILSALDSAPIRRLEWQRNITEGLKEYCALIDSSSSFRAYRQALAETGPPCIPYIGLILQDLTFVHIGNSDFFAEGTINFSKRWQQFNILDNMRRFKHCQYSVKRNEQIISFFNNFDDYLCEEAMWQISETIKPRGGKKKSCDNT